MMDDPAFPVAPGTRHDHSGITKREYMAAKVMAGLTANHSVTEGTVALARQKVGQGQEEAFANKTMATLAVALADALIEALNQ